MKTHTHARTEAGWTSVSRHTPGHLSQVDGLHGLFQMGLNVLPQLVRVCLLHCAQNKHTNIQK